MVTLAHHSTCSQGYPQNVGVTGLGFMVSLSCFWGRMASDGDRLFGEELNSYIEEVSAAGLYRYL
jgi:hypothetical protein